MKKKNLLVTLTSTLAAVSLLGGCGNSEEEVTIKSVSFKGIYTTYSADEEIVWDDMSVVINYSDNTAATISVADIEFDVATPVSNTTKAIVDTSGLHAMTTLVDGKYDVKVSFKEDFSKFYGAGSITVGTLTADKYDLVSYAEPQFVTKYKSNIENAGYVLQPGASAADVERAEDYFKDGVGKGGKLTVGTWNTFKFKPQATFLRKGAPIDEDPILSNNYVKDIVLKEVQTESEVDADTADYQIVKEGIKFATSAIGKTFKLTMSPKEFKKTFTQKDVTPVELTFDVKDGYNVYTAKELGILNLTSIKDTDNAGDMYWEMRVGKDGSGNLLGNGYDSIFPGDSNNYVVKDTVSMWEKFLVDSGTFTESEIQSFVDVPAVYLLDDITINGTVDADYPTLDIPADFFLKDGERANVGNVATGALRDGAWIYNMPLNVERTINGNYFKVDASRIPLCRNCTQDGALYVYTESDVTINPGHAVLFGMNGLVYRDGETHNNYRKAGVLDEHVKQGRIMNVNSVGNTTHDIGKADKNFAKMIKVTGLIFTKAGYSNVEVKNSIVKEYMIGINADQNLGQEVTGDNPVPQTDHFKVTDCKVYDCSNSGLFNYKCGGMLVSGSELKRFGGAAIINAGDDEDAYKCATTKFTSDCIVENKVTGEEVYYAAVGASASIAELKGLNQILAAGQRSFVAQDGTMNVVSLCMDGDGYVASDKRAFYAETIFNCDTAAKFGGNLMSKDATSLGVLYTTIPQLLSTYAPVCNTELFPYPTIMLPTTIPAGAFNNPTPLIPATDITPGLYVPTQLQPVPELTAVAALTQGQPMPGSYLNMYAPAGKTTLNIIFGI